MIDYGPAFEFDLKKTIQEVLEKKPSINVISKGQGKLRRLK
jgi:hypothetical protein